MSFWSGVCCGVVGLLVFVGIAYAAFVHKWAGDL